MKKITLIIISVFFLLQTLVFANPSEKVKLETSLGDIVIELDQQKAPKTVENFKQYVNSGFFSGTIFHRVMKGFMIQGGGLTSDMQKKKANTQVQNEANNGLKNNRGTIAMARTNLPHSASSQFFINTVNNDRLNYREKSNAGWGYCVFGKVISGMEIVDQIEKTPTTTKDRRQNVPVDTITIKKAVMIQPDKK